MYLEVPHPQEPVLQSVARNSICPLCTLNWIPRNDPEGCLPTKTPNPLDVVLIHASIVKSLVLNLSVGASGTTTRPLPLKLTARPTSPCANVTPPIKTAWLVPIMSPALPSLGHQAKIPSGGSVQLWAGAEPAKRSDPSVSVATTNTRAQEWSVFLFMFFLSSWPAKGAGWLS